MTKLLRYILVLFLCGTTTATMADNYTPINENFSNFQTPSNYNSGATIINQWEMYYCVSKKPLNSIENNALLINCNSNQDPSRIGYAITPEIGYSGDVSLSYKYGNSSDNNANMKITIIGEGTFSDDRSTTKEVTITRKFASNNGPFSVNYSITGVTTNTKIKFHFKKLNSNIYYYYYIDDIVITKDGMTLNEATDNNSVITAHPDTTMNVKTVRTLTDGIWNTMCLPFAVNKETMAAAWDTSVELRTYSGYSNNTMSFSSTESVDAGTPFLIKVGKTITNPTFESVTIRNTTDTIINHDGIKFIGTFSGSNLNTNGSHLFITTSGTVATPLDNHNHLKGLRAYIEVPTNAGVRLAIDGETTDIRQRAMAEEQPVDLYNLNGQRLQSSQKGIIIKDGKLIFTK